METSKNNICYLPYLASDANGIYFPVKDQINTISWRKKTIKAMPYMDVIKERAPWQCGNPDCNSWNPWYEKYCYKCTTPRGYTKPEEGFEDEI